MPIKSVLSQFADNAKVTEVNEKEGNLMVDFREIPMPQMCPNFSIVILSFVKIIQKMPTYMAFNKKHVIIRTQLLQHQ